MLKHAIASNCDLARQHQAQRQVRGVAVAVVLAGGVVLVLPQVLRQLVVRVVHLLDGLPVVAEVLQLLDVRVHPRHAVELALEPRPVAVPAVRVPHRPPDAGRAPLHRLVAPPPAPTRGRAVVSQGASVS